MIFYYLLVSIMPLERHSLWAGTFGTLTVIKYIGGAAALYAFVYAFVRRSQVSYFRTWTARAYALYAVSVLASYALTGNMDDWQQSVFLVSLSNLIMFFVTLTVIDSIKRLRRVLMCFVGAVAFASLYAIRDWQKYHGLYAGYRPSGAAGDPNYFCLTAVFAIPVALYLAFERPSLWHRAFCLCSVLVIIIAVTLGASRGGFLGLAAVALTIVLRARKRRLLYLAVLSALVIGPGLLLPNSPLVRLVKPSAGDTGNAVARTTVWLAGLKMIQQEPVLGIGAGKFKSEVAGYQTDGAAVSSMAHNTYLEIAAEMGLPVFLTWLMTLAGAIHILNRARNRAQRARVPLLGAAAMGIQAGLIGSLFCITFISAEFEKDLWFFIFLSITVYALSLRCRDRHARRRPSEVEWTPGEPLAARRTIGFDGIRPLHAEYFGESD